MAAARAKAELVRTCKMLVAFSRFSMAQRAFSGLATCKMLRAFCRCSCASNDTGVPCNPIRGRAVGWCARSEEDTCSMLRAFSRSRGRNVPASASRCPIPRQCSHYDCNRPPWCIWSDEEKRWLRDLAARHVPHGICLKGSGSMLGLSFDAEQGCWWSVCIHGRSRYWRLLKTFVVVIGKSEHEAARRILM